ncbi:hypothetical protein L2E82_48375 [Cichorium intybus]|uniref:Uncharacterized protein n=1 Tax=Cichorium intybus TaxID=13427 RepID=A0ACB8YYR5_CICIN|nr:hypothetical protein L2E82_48375 [Cichorium intybus]
MSWPSDYHNLHRTITIALCWGAFGSDECGGFLTTICMMKGVVGYRRPWSMNNEWREELDSRYTLTMVDSEFAFEPPSDEEYDYEDINSGEDDENKNGDVTAATYIKLSISATSFDMSQLQPIFPYLEFMPDTLYLTIPYLLSFVMGDPIKMSMGLSDINLRLTLLWKLKILKFADAYANSRLHAVKAEVLVLARSGLFRHEVSRVLGGVLSPGSLVLISDDPNVGKRTLMLQIVAIIAEGRAIGKPAPILYVSGEEGFSSNSICSPVTQDMADMVASKGIPIKVIK